MSENTTAIATTNDNAIAALFSGSESFFSSMPMETEEDKAAQFNATNCVDDRLKSKIGEKLEIVHLIAQEVVLTDDETGEVERRAPRIILVDKNGRSYGCLSKGIVGALAKAVSIYGPPPWTPPLVFQPFMTPAKKGDALTLKIIPRKLPKS